MTLTDFLLARIAEDEDVARYCIDRQDSGVWRQHVGDDIIRDERSGQEIVHYDGLRYRSDAYHVIRHAPARVLRECEAKRRIVDRETNGGSCQGHPGPYLPHGDYGPGYCRDYDTDTLRDLAAVYADHADYREEWKP